MILDFLGTGTSHGIPVIGCDCALCRKPSRFDTRYRSSLFIRGDGGERILIDCGPEFRLQAVRADIRRVDAVLLTHAHADHSHGIDDLRPLSRRKSIPVYGNQVALEELAYRFAYIFDERNEGGGKPQISLEPLYASLRLGAIEIRPIPLKHGSLDIYGWRIEEGGRVLVYASDVKTIPPDSLPLMNGADILVLGTLQARDHRTHFSFGEAKEVLNGLSTGAAWATHLCHEHSQSEITGLLYPQACPARDGLRIIL